jgi:DDE superfamily endonuclease
MCWRSTCGLAIPTRPLVCLDETSKQLIAETRVPIPMKPGRAARVDYEYERNGTANLFMLFAPLEGWRHVKVTDRHTAIDYAHILKELADIHFPRAKTIVLIQDNLNIHSKASLYEAFPAAEARRLVERFEGTTRPSTAAGLISQNPNSAFCPPTASTAAFPTNRSSSRKSPPGSKTAMPITPSQTGTSPPKMLALTQASIPFNLTESGD